MRMGTAYIISFLLFAQQVQASIDPVDQLVSQLSTLPWGKWMSGRVPINKLPSSATAAEVVSQAVERNYAGYKIIMVRKVQIGDIPGEFTAVLIQTNKGQKIVLMKYENGWWSRIYDA